jgi:E2F-associated phosphoprotein
MLYDPEADSEDEKALGDEREGRKSDAILSCPGCFAMLCFDCQQHAHDDTLFRAMFVQNCRLLDQGQGELKVLCDACETEVGSYDEADELYLFDSVIASEA